MPIHRVANVEEAVQLASNLCQIGDYDWFRGQVRDRPLISSYNRLKQVEQEEHKEKIRRFEQWVKTTQGLEAIANNADAMVAVAQHYGLPTCFVDFTTNPAVAGFFASERKPSDPNYLSCIMCLNTQDLRKFWKPFPAKFLPPEFLKLDVPNLWRLEAQSGVFLFCPYTHFENFYNLDRIIFPYCGHVSRPKSEEIYPVRKSPLEILLDQYFMNEKLIQGEKNIHKIFGPKLTTFHLEGPTDRFDPELIGSKKPSQLSSWNLKLIENWFIPVRESYAQVIDAIEVELKYPITDYTRNNIETYKKEIVDQVVPFASKRNSLVNWKIESISPKKSDLFTKNINANLCKLWDGMRLLPYEIEDIGESLANCILLNSISNSERFRSLHNPWESVASICFGDSIEVEFGANDGSYARGYASTSTLLYAVRNDIADFLNPNYKDQLIGNITGLLQAVQLPNCLFEFGQFIKIFGRQIIPTQILTRGDDAVFYSPVRLDAFGLP